MINVTIYKDQEHQNFILGFITQGHKTSEVKAEIGIVKPNMARYNTIWRMQLLCYSLEHKLSEMD